MDPCAVSYIAASVAFHMAFLVVARAAREREVAAAESRRDDAEP